MSEWKVFECCYNTLDKLHVDISTASFVIKQDGGNSNLVFLSTEDLKKLKKAIKKMIKEQGGTDETDY